MTTPPTAGPGDLERKVRQLDNDMQAVYGLLAGISEVVNEHTLRFDAIETRFDGIDGRLDGMDSRFDAMDTRFDAMDTRFDAMDTRFDGVDATLREVLRRLPEAS